MVVLLIAAPAAVWASGTGKVAGGTSASTASSGSTTTSTSTSTAPASPTVTGGSTTEGTPAGGAQPKTHVHTAPITAHTASLAYKGPVYEKSVTGQIVPYVAPAAPGVVGGETGGSPVGVVADTKPELLVPGSTARYVEGLAAAPMSAPVAVQDIIWAGDQIVGLPYIYGGGHASFESPGYDCSGTVSFALHGASLLAAPEDSSEFMVWGSHGDGRWVTIFSNAGHAYMTVAGLRLDTSSADDPSNQQGPRWRPLRPANAGFTVRHPLGL